MTKTAYQMRKERERDKVIGTIVGVIIGIVLGALLLQFAWNVGLVGTLAAAGLNISGISYWTALGALVLLMFVRGTLSTIGMKGQ